jgi:hypothetical protein
VRSDLRNFANAACFIHHADLSVQKAAQFMVLRHAKRFAGRTAEPTPSQQRVDTFGGGDPANKDYVLLSCFCSRRTAAIWPLERQAIGF